MSTKEENEFSFVPFLSFVVSLELLILPLASNRMSMDRTPFQDVASCRAQWF